MRRQIIAVLLFAVLVSVPVSADTCSYECQWWTYEGCGYEMLVCRPEYHVWQYTQPDWCLYHTGDNVAITYQNFQPVAWYVVPYDDPNPPGSWYVVNNQYGCFVIVF
jgi:hypothetical protein